MAETTLHPLTARERRELAPDSDRDLLTQARERFAWAEEHESREREQQRAALTFRAGAHWPAQAPPEGGQAAALEMVIDRLNPMIQQVLNAYRRSPLAMRVRPKSGGASKQVADILEGALRDIEQQSEADIAYYVALDQACGQGLGYFRLTTEYEDDYSFQQVLRIKPLYNCFAVFVDPASRHPAALDLEWAFIIERMARSRFMQYYEVEPQELTAICGDRDGTWHTASEVQVAEYYYKTYTRQTLVRLPDGRVLPAEGLHDLDPTWPTRETRLPTVHWCTIAGNAVLTRTTWLGTHVPLIRVEGQRLEVDGAPQRTGMVQAGRDAQMSIDFYSTAEANAIAAAPKAPYLLYAEQISGYERYWNAANDATMPYLLHKAVVVNGQLLPPPQRQAVEPPIQAISAAKLMAQQDLQSTLGMFEAAMGAPSNEQSGVAIDKRKIESEGTNFTYSANLAWSIRALGTMCVEVFPKLHTGPGQVRQVSPDGTVKETMVNAPYQDEQGHMQQHMLAQGQYDVTIASGPSYETSRMQTSEKLSGVLGAVQPEIQRYFLDTWAGSLDFPGSEDLAARFKTLVPKEALAASEQQDPRNQLVMMQSQLQEATQGLQMLQQQLEQSKQTETVATQQVALLEKALADLKVRLDNKAQELQVDAQKAQWQYQIDQEKNAIDWKELELKYAFGQPNGALLPPHGQEVPGG